MTAKTRTTAVHSGLAENYFRKAQEYRDSMNQALAERRANAAALNGIHCAISAADSLCVRYHGKRSSGKDHGDAVRHRRDDERDVCGLAAHAGSPSLSPAWASARVAKIGNTSCRPVSSKMRRIAGCA